MMHVIITKPFFIKLDRVRNPFTLFFKARSRSGQETLFTQLFTACINIIMSHRGV